MSNDKFVYRNLNTGDEVAYSIRSVRLDALPNWVLSGIPDDLGKPQPEVPTDENDPRRVPGLIGSSRIGGGRSERDPVFAENTDLRVVGDLPPSVPVITAQNRQPEPRPIEEVKREAEKAERKDSKTQQPGTVSEDDLKKTEAEQPQGDRPARNATREEWAEYAVKKRGADAKQVESMKRDDLIAKFGN